MKLIKKYTIKIPKNICVLYFEKQKLLTISGPLNKKSIILDLKISVLNEIKTIFITKNSFYVSNKKKTKKLRGTLVSRIKQIILECSVNITKKLKLSGVGFKISKIQSYDNELLQLKLGYTHLIFFKTNIKNIKIFCLKSTKLFIFGNSYYNVNQLAAKIKSYKEPDPYKGKGILYENENIILKEGKKI